jgi:hypothetical protein
MVHPGRGLAARPGGRGAAARGNNSIGLNGRSTLSCIILPPSSYSILLQELGQRVVDGKSLTLNRFSYLEDSAT